MARNYFAELKTNAISYSEIARQTGINRHKVSEYARGARALPPQRASGEYHRVYNYSRRIGYQASREVGRTPKLARAGRVQILKAGKPIKQTVRNVNYLQKSVRYVLRLLAKFRHKKTGEIKVFEVFSDAHLKRNYEKMKAEALEKVSRSAWELVVILEQEFVEYRLSPGGETR